LNKKLFIGIGNLHRADDGIGVQIANRLKENESLKKAGVEVMDHSGEGASLMHIWENADLVVVVDAMKNNNDKDIGKIHYFDATKEVLNYGVFRYSSHLFSLAEATELSRKLEMLPKKLIIYGVESKMFDFGSKMSDEVKASIKEIEKAVIQEFVV